MLLAMVAVIWILGRFLRPIINRVVQWFRPAAHSA